MARKLRIEYEHALYHVLNRGNYRSDIFGTEGAKLAFERCLFETCEKAKWRLHAYVLMRNHYHLALETPRANLVVGMQWLQATFANRFNRMRREHGHVFQGRYQALLVEDGARLGAVCHYIHLNPVRAKVCSAERLQDFRYSSYYWLNQPRKRPACLDFSAALESAGGLVDTTAGRRAYGLYLAWLASETQAQQAFGFEAMSRGWALGTQSFKQALVQEQKQRKRSGRVSEAETAELRELGWEALLQRCLKKLRIPEEKIAGARKAEAWKVAIATHMKEKSTARNPWLAKRLQMGDPDGVSRYCSECRAGHRPAAAKLLTRITDIRV